MLVAGSKRTAEKSTAGAAKREGAAGLAEEGLRESLRQMRLIPGCGAVDPLCAAEVEMSGLVSLTRKSTMARH